MGRHASVLSVKKAIKAMEIVNKAKQGIDVTDVRVMKKANTGRVMKKAKAFGSRRSVMRVPQTIPVAALPSLGGKIVSVQASEASKENYAKLQAWNTATQSVSSPDGPALYAKTKALLASPHVHWPCFD